MPFYPLEHFKIKDADGNLGAPLVRGVFERRGHIRFIQPKLESPRNGVRRPLKGGPLNEAMVLAFLSGKRRFQTPA